MQGEHKFMLNRVLVCSVLGILPRLSTWEDKRADLRQVLS
jgi:hypothetical protein